MTARSADELRGWECDWLGSDGEGHVALFSTAGGGFTPDEFLRDTDAHAEAIDAIIASPASTRAKFAPDLRPSAVNTWKIVAERGLFAFDGDLNGGPYVMVAAPEVPAQAAQLPASVAKVLRGLEFRHIRFADLSAISEEDLRQPR